MTERPILMLCDHPKLILEGRKTQTRRIVKLPIYAGDATKVTWGCIGGKGFGFIFGGPSLDLHNDTLLECPYGVAGDRLVVLEKWRTRKQWDHLAPTKLPIYDNALPDCDIDWAATPSHQIHGRWRPSIHLPRRFARITLEITKVRVERLQDISYSDVMSEGIYADVVNGEHTKAIASLKPKYAALWDSLHGKGAWDSNPWVWVIEFKQL